MYVYTQSGYLIYFIVTIIVAQVSFVRFHSLRFS